MSSDIADEGVKFEELENVIIDTNTERYFQIRSPIASSREGGIASFP